jgi:hypothetical protein
VLETALGQRAEAHLAALAERTKVLLGEHRANVLAVGHALEMHKTISGQDVTAIIDGSQGPLVDGRPYKTQEFAAELDSSSWPVGPQRITAATAACRCLSLRRLRWSSTRYRR